MARGRRCECISAAVAIVWRPAYEPDRLSIDADNMPDFLVRLRDGLRFSHGFAEWRGGFEDWRDDRTRLAASAVGPALDGEAAVEEIGAGRAAASCACACAWRFRPAPRPRR